MPVEIAGTKTSSDWERLRLQLKSNPPDVNAWQEAKEFFDQRFENRYFKPIEAIRSHYSANNLRGEGFAICTLLCSLIEAVETFHEGKNFSLNPSTEFEYGPRKSGQIYTNFLTQRHPFSGYFDLALAKDFYSNVRCALLHEACTRNKWKINIRGSETITREGGYKILNRSLFLTDMHTCINAYQDALLADESLRSAFVRKFDGICRNSE